MQFCLICFTHSNRATVSHLEPFLKDLRKCTKGLYFILTKLLVVELFFYCTGYLYIFPMYVYHQDFNVFLFAALASSYRHKKCTSNKSMGEMSWSRQLLLSATLESMESWKGTTFFFNLFSVAGTMHLLFSKSI